MLTDRQPFSVTALRLSAGIIIWAVHFAVIYGYTGLACARRFEASGALWTGAVPWVIGVATLTAAAFTLALIVPVLRARGAAGFTEWLGAGLAGLALAGILLEGAAVLVLPVCPVIQ